MKNVSKILLGLFFLSMINSCADKSTFSYDTTKSEAQIRTTLGTLLKSIENKDIEALKSTMSPSGKMELAVQGSPISYTVKEFVDFHDGWFKDTTWTMETKILNIEAGQYLGAATTEAIYREPDRNGKPYMNHMIVSYVLQKLENNQWYVIKDHASTLTKTEN